MTIKFTKRLAWIEDAIEHELSESRKAGLYQTRNNLVLTMLSQHPSMKAYRKGVDNGLYATLHPKRHRP